MTELYFLRHGERIDHALQNDPMAKPILSDYYDYDPSLSINATEQLQSVAEEIILTTKAFTRDPNQRKNVYIHFSPYLRCCQSADILLTALKQELAIHWLNYKVKFLLLGDFALSEWIHDRMGIKPPLIDSNDAYKMYTANIKLLKNKGCCSNFRPTTTLGPFNGPELNYKDYQMKCKDYFTKLLAYYDKPNYIKNKDIIIVISHGYAINNFMTFFINHPIFEEIPEAKINFAEKIPYDDDEVDLEEYDPEDYTWKLEKDALDIIDEHMDYTLNLETDIIYYKTNFVKRDELNGKAKGATPDFNKPRDTFKITAKKPSNNYLCPAAKDWIPGAKLYEIKKEFKQKLINDATFRANFNLSNHPSRVVTPDVSPNSEPTRSNSVIDLTKLLSNEDIQNPIKLKYSDSYEIPIHRLNSKVNSQVSLTFSESSASSQNSRDGSMVDLSKLFLRAHPSTSPPSIPRPNDVQNTSYFPELKSRSELSLNDTQNQIPSFGGRDSPINTLSRARSGVYNHNKRRHQPRSLTPNRPSSTLRNEQQQQQQPQHSGLTKYPLEVTSDTPSESEPEEIDKYFSLSFTTSPSSPNSTITKSESPRRSRSRKNSIKFIGSGYDVNGPVKKVRPIFYNFNSDTDGDDEDEEVEDSSSASSASGSRPKYVWFGQNL